MSFWDKFRDKWRILPILGPLVFCTTSDHAKALKEFLMSVSFATATFWVSAIVFRLFKSNADKSYLDLLQSTISNGELLIFSVSFLGPVFLAAAADPNGKNEFPGRSWHMFALIGVSGISALIFAVNKAFSSIKFPEPLGTLAQHIDTTLIVNYSLFLAATALILRYLTIVYSKSMQAPDESMRQDDISFAERFARHRGIKK